MSELKDAVTAFWEEAACGEIYAEGTTIQEKLAAQAASRYRLDPHIPDFARFERGAGRRVLEIGVGMGADHLRWAEAGPGNLVGIDLTWRALAWTAQRLSASSQPQRLAMGDAECLPFPSDSFDIVYSWGVLHHSPDTAGAFREVHRVLRPGGRALLMIYHRPSIVGVMLWLRYGLGRGRPQRTLTEMYAEHLESPGTKGYTVDEARQLAGSFRGVDIRTQLGNGDLLEGDVGKRHGSAVLRLAKLVWPRPLIRRTLKRYGLLLMIEATK
jgi:SAM-dependent methyltransferase